MQTRLLFLAEIYPQRGRSCYKDRTDERSTTHIAIATIMCVAWLHCNAFGQIFHQSSFVRHQGSTQNWDSSIPKYNPQAHRTQLFGMLSPKSESRISHQDFSSNFAERGRPIPPGLHQKEIETAQLYIYIYIYLTHYALVVLPLVTVSTNHHQQRAAQPPFCWCSLSSWLPLLNFNHYQKEVVAPGIV